MGTGRASGDGRAREAAEAAIASPLLESVDLAGAKGLLVNVTAGMDISIGEFDEVGNTIKELASEDATVVVGAVIDPEMQNELRVTIVATGIGQVAASDVEETATAASVKLVKKGSEADLERPRYERPTGGRQKASGDNFGDRSESDLDYLDIPAFLRRQAD
jgi:cell division protein FtsZ